MGSPKKFKHGVYGYELKSSDSIQDMFLNMMAPRQQKCLGCRYYINREIHIFDSPKLLIFYLPESDITISASITTTSGTTLYLHCILYYADNHFNAHLFCADR